MKKHLLSFIIFLMISVLLLSGCGRGAQNPADNHGRLGVHTDKTGADADQSNDFNWLITVSDTKNFIYKIPNSNGGVIDMTVKLYFIAWKVGGENIFGQYEGRALIAYDMDLSKAGDSTISYQGGCNGGQYQR